MDTVRRTIRIVSEEPSKKGSKARLYGYGVRAVASVAGVAVKTVRRASAAREVKLDTLASVVEWTTKRRSAHTKI